MERSTLTIMALVLSAEQRSIEKVFSAPENFVIPAYQRPYSWEYDQCFQLYKDLTSAFEDNKKDYFIGNVIIAKSATERTNRYVVDGQQRLITMWLFLRIANLLFPDLKVLRKMTVNESRKEGLADELNIRSLVFETGDDEALLKIFDYKTQESFEQRYKECCNRNGRFVESRCNSRVEISAIWLYIWLKSFKGKDAERCEDFIFFIIDQVFLLPIELTGDSVDEANNKALKIFETINNRGMNLEDADIFKAKLYDKAVANNEKDNFIRQWQDFRLVTEDELGLKVDDIFRYYSHIIRGMQRITSSETNIRELFVEADYSPLISKTYTDVMAALMRIIDCLKYMDYKLSDKSEISKWMQVIKAYSNQYPNYAIVTFLFIKGFDCDSKFQELLKSLIRYVYYTGSTTTVKFEIYNIIKSICNNEPINDYRINREADTKLYFHPRLRKGFALLAYYLQGKDSLVDYTYDKILTYKDLERTSPSQFEDNQSAANCIESIGNDIIVDKPKKYLDWTERMKYYGTFDFTRENEIKAEEDIIAFIEKRDKQIQNTLDNYFFT